MLVFVQIDMFCIYVFCAFGFLNILPLSSLYHIKPEIWVPKSRLLAGIINFMYAGWRNPKTGHCIVIKMQYPVYFLFFPIRRGALQKLQVLTRFASQYLPYYIIM
jgi:hypothetical protein